MSETVQKGRRNVVNPFFYFLIGVIFIVIGFLTVIWPIQTSEIFKTAVTIISFVYGALGFIMWITFKENKYEEKKQKGKKPKSKGIYIFQGFFGAILGIASLIWPEVIILLISILLIFFGVSEAYKFFKLSSYKRTKWFFLVIGIFSIIIGLALIPSISGQVKDILWVVSLFSFVFGAFSVLKGFYLSKDKKNK